MAASTLPEPGKVVRGEEIGPCKDVCEHTDCATTRRMAAADCAICGKPIGYETRFYNSNPEDNLRWFGNRISPCGPMVDTGGPKNVQLVHAVCIEEKVRKENRS
jgi:hypothetical protein